MRKLSINIPVPDRSDFVKVGAKANKGVRIARSWLAKRIEPKASKPKEKEKS